MATAKDRAKRIIKDRFAAKSDVPQRMSAILGDSDGNIRVPGRPDLVFVRVNAQANKIWKVPNSTVADILDLQVVIEKNQAGTWSVVEVDRSTLLAVGSSFGGQALLPFHHLDHEWPDMYPGADAVDVYRRAIRPLRLEVSGESLISRAGVTVYNGSLLSVPEQTAALSDLTIPASGVALAVSYIDIRTAQLSFAFGQPVAYDVAANPLPPALPWYAAPQAAVRLYASQASLSEGDVVGDYRVSVVPLGLKHNYGSDTAPTAADDELAGYSPGSIWVDSTGGDFYICVDATAGAAVWSSGGGGGGDEWVYIDRNGFVNNTETAISFDDSTYVFTLSDTGAGWKYFRSGVVYTITGNKTITLAGSPPTAGLYYVFIDDTDGTLQVSTTPWTLEDDALPVATVRWDSTLTPKYWLADERHTCLIDRRDHLLGHLTRGTQFVGGGVPSGYTVAPSSPTNTNNTIAISEARIADEDLIFTLDALSDQNGTDTNYVCFYRISASEWEWVLSAFPYMYNPAGYIFYDNGGSMAEGINAKYYNTYLLLTDMGGLARFAFVHGRAEFSSLANAQAEDVTAFDWSGLSISESVIAWRLTWYANASYSTKGKCRLAAEPQSINVTTVLSAGGIAHNTLAGIQGGTTGEYYHLTGAQATNVANLTAGTLDVAKISKLWESDGGAVAWQTDAAGQLTGNSTRDIFPQASTNGLNARFERLFGDDKPANNYFFTGRPFLVNSSPNILGFEDSQASPYSVPGGYNFSINLVGNAEARSNAFAHWLRFGSGTSTLGSYIEWSSSTGLRIWNMLSALQITATGSDLYAAELRLWDVQTPTANDRWWALRWRYYDATYSVWPARIERWYSAAVGDGLTFTATTGTMSGSYPYRTGSAIINQIVIMASGPSGAMIDAHYPAESTAPFAGHGSSASSMPQTCKCARLYLWSQQCWFNIDHIWMVA